MKNPMNPLPRTDTSTERIVDAFTALMYVLGETGRATIRAHLLSMSESADARNCLAVMNDVERVMDWKARTTGK